MSTSFPYLTLSRRLCARYGDVLRVVDYLDRVYGQDYMHRPVVYRHGMPPDVSMTVDVWCREQERRRNVLSAS